MPMDKESLSLTLDALKQFAEERLTDERLLEFDHKDEFPEEVVRAIGSTELGIQLVFIPEEYGGMGGGAFDVYRVCEAMGRIDVGLATGVLATFLGSDPIVFGGTEDQKAHWLGRIANEGLLMAYGATEPQAGSDLAQIKTVAVPVEENGKVVGYKITGNKQWISNGGRADIYTILANTPGGPTWFVLERGVPGFTQGKPEDKHGIRSSNTTTLALDDVYVDVDRIVGHVEGQGLVQAQLVFGFTRVMVAAFGLGAGWAALDRAIKYSTERVQGGSPLSEKQGYTHKLIVPHAVALEAGRAYIEETAEGIDTQDSSLNTEGAIAKYLSTEAGNQAADAAIQAHGGYGYTKEYMVEKIKRDVRITTIYEGTSEIMEMTIARDRWQYHMKSRGQHYHDAAKRLEGLHVEFPNHGADIAALANHALAEVLELARIGKLTRNQHILFRVGELIAFAEGAAALARRAVHARKKTLNEKADARFTPDALAAISRVFARTAAHKIVSDGARWMFGADDQVRDVEGLLRSFRFAEIQRVQYGLLQDMDYVADVLYGRTA
ncbi:MAG: acyl-CoA dehydrogenase family protein [Deltaproteobacteria bacterium]|nr:acyl-CoA dehydrogenase family protein [Deltaproteobacteria bacterium]